MKREGSKVYPFWLLFAVCLLVWLMSSAVTVVPDSAAERTIAIVCPSSLAFAVVLGIVAVWRTIASARKTKEEQA